MMEYYLSTMYGEPIKKSPDAPMGNCGLTHSCPFCGGQASLGRVLNWVAGECILNGEAIFPCKSCGREVSAPSTIFVEKGLAELKKLSLDQASGRLDQRRLYFSMVQMSLKELLVADWGDVIQAWNTGSRN